MSFFNKLKKSLTKTRQHLTHQVGRLLSSSAQLDESFFEELEEILLTADVGVKTSIGIVERLQQEVKIKRITDPVVLGGLLQEEVAGMLGKEGTDLLWSPTPPTVILVVGVNGVGKTTTIGKLACSLGQEGKKVLLAAADTFRAAATEQLAIWAERSGAGIISHQINSDPAAVVFDALQSARNRQYDVLLIDTAGRLQTKTNLMDELKKIYRVIGRQFSEAPHEVLLVLDATTGQNALSQAKLFKEAVGVTGIALTKLDGTAKGGVVLAIAAEIGIPVKLVGLGEGADDLKNFKPQDFASVLFSDFLETGEV